MIRFASLALSILLASPVAAQVIVHDGNSIRLDGKRIRLAGIDSPELGQSCNGWDAGDAAAKYLRDLIAGQRVRCEAQSVDVFGRTIATCYAGDLDINAAMVRAGYARAYTKYSGAYIVQETRAKAAKLGIWAHDCEAPWTYRHEGRR